MSKIVLKSNLLTVRSVVVLILSTLFILGSWFMVPTQAIAETASSAASYESTENSRLMAQVGGLVNCGQQTDEAGRLTNPCDWRDFVSLINDLVTWLIQLATAIATLLFMYAGFLYLTAGGKEDQAEQAKGIFGSVAVGFGIILIAWLLVRTVVVLLTGEGWIDDNSELLPISQEVDTIEVVEEIQKHA